MKKSSSLSNVQRQISKKSLSEIDFSQFDKQGIFYSEIYGSISNDYQ
jgi:hypothetical protein